MKRATPEQLDKLEQIASLSNQVLELYKLNKVLEGNMLLSEVLKDIQDFKMQKYCVDREAAVADVVSSDDQDENDENAPKKIKSAAKSGSRSKQKEYAPKKACCLVSDVVMREIFLGLIKKLVEDADYRDSQGTKIHLTQVISKNAHKLATGTTDYLTFKFRVKCFLDALYSDVYYLGAERIPNMNVTTLKRDLREYVVQEQEMILAKFMNNKNITTQGHDCFLVQARRLPGGWVFKRFIPTILVSPSTVPPSAGTAGFGDEDASVEMAPNAFAGVFYSWKPNIVDPKIVVRDQDCQLSCSNLPPWLQIDQATNTLHGTPPLINSTQYLLQLTANYKRITQDIEVKAEIRLSLYYYSNLEHLNLGVLIDQTMN